MRPRAAQLRDRKHSASPKNSSGVMHSRPKKVASLLMGRWGGDEEECARYRAYPCHMPQKDKTALPMLFKPLTEDVVQAAPETLKGGSSAGKDGMLVERHQMHE